MISPFDHPILGGLLEDPDRFQTRIASLRAEYVFNLGHSSERAAREIARLADNRPGDIGAN